MAEPPFDDARFVAGVDLLGRSGAEQFQIRYCEEEDPVVWIAAAHWTTERATRGRGPTWDAAAGMTPWRALYRLLEAVLDGGTCTHCQKMVSVDDKPASAALDAMNPLVCFFRYDPELATFRRSCEGVAA